MDQIEKVLNEVTQKAVFGVGLHGSLVCIFLKGDGVVLEAAVTPEQAMDISMRFFQLAVKAKATELEEGA